MAEPLEKTIADHASAVIDLLDRRGLPSDDAITVLALVVASFAKCTQSLDVFRGIAGGIFEELHERNLNE